MKTLVWVTHSFRLDSRLTSNLTSECTFVYYSPYYFAGEREREILSKCSKRNLDAFYQSLRIFKRDLKNKGHVLNIFKEKNPIQHINKLISKYGFDNVVIDLPIFGMWKSVNVLDISVPFKFIDSDLIDDTCPRMTAKSRWMTHIKQIDKIKWNKWNHNIDPFNIDELTKKYPKESDNCYLIDPKIAINRAESISPTYGQTRDRFDGQTRLSTAFQNGTVDPHNTFFLLAKYFNGNGADFTKNEGAHAAMLRQFAFREISIIQTRRENLTMEDSIEDWSSRFLTEKSRDNLNSRVNPNSNLTFEKIKTATTGDQLVDRILRESFDIGVMPNRARMFFAGWLFYNSPTGNLALKWLIDTFNLLLLDGQCPVTYTQCVTSMNLQYGRVMLLNRERVESLLYGKN